MLILSFENWKKKPKQVKVKNCVHSHSETLSCFDMSSGTASVVSIILLLKHFNETNGQKFKHLLLKELECSDETQFLCKIIQTLSRSLTNESLIRLKNETIKPRAC